MVVFEDVAGRLAMLGYAVTEDQRAAVEYAIESALQRLKAELNRADIPDALHNTHIDVAAGLFLRDIRAARGFDTADAGAGEKIKAISEGDVKVEYETGAGADSARLDALIAKLVNPPEKILAAFRRFAW